MKYEWDENKYKKNIKDHGLRFEDAQMIFADLNAKEFSFVENGEERWLRIGLNPFKGILTVIYCERGEDRRIISCWKSTSTERSKYEEGL